MNSKAQKKDGNTILTEILNIPKANENATAVVSDPQSNKVQKKFDEVFTESNDDLDFLSAINEENQEGSKLKIVTEQANEIKMDFDTEDLNLEIHTPDSTGVTKQTESMSSASEIGGLDLDDLQSGLELGIANNDFNEGTKKTVIINAKDLNLNELDKPIEQSIKENDLSSISAATDNELEMGSGDLIKHTDTKDKIESTIKEIVSAKSELTGDFDIASLVNEDQGTSSFDADTEVSKTVVHKPELEEIGFNFTTTGSKNDFKTDPNLFSVNNDGPSSTARNINSSDLFDVDEITSPPPPPAGPDKQYGTPYSISDHSSEIPKYGIDDNLKVHSTIKQLIEERESLIATIKQQKNDLREFEQDNLTLKAYCDEAKIEINILKKRFITELEEYKHRLILNDEKKAILEERVKQLEKMKEKFEQKARIDINQVRQREKELESKLELMSMDVDSQIQSRDQKILELRRKIDSLEFNMENVSIKEQKTADDKRKLEDKLNKIMKTLRNSIKNLEEDIESNVELKLRTEKDK